MEILISDLALFLESLPKDNETRIYILSDDEVAEDNSLQFWLKGDLTMVFAKSLGCSIEWDHEAITIDNPGQDLSTLKELGNMDEQEFVTQFSELTGWCDGGDDIDYAMGMPSVLGDLITLYLAEQERIALSKNPHSENGQTPAIGDDAT